MTLYSSCGHIENLQNPIEKEVCIYCLRDLFGHSIENFEQRRAEIIERTHSDTQCYLCRDSFDYTVSTFMCSDCIIEKPFRYILYNITENMRKYICKDLESLLSCLGKFTSDSKFILQYFYKEKSVAYELGHDSSFNKWSINNYSKHNKHQFVFNMSGVKGYFTVQEFGQNLKYG